MTGSWISNGNATHMIAVAILGRRAGAAAVIAYSICRMLTRPSGISCRNTTSLPCTVGVSPGLTGGEVVGLSAGELEA